MHLSLSEIEPQSLGRRAISLVTVPKPSVRAVAHTHTHTHTHTAARIGAENIVLSCTLWP